MAQDNQSLVHREMARKSQDIHRVKNPTDQDYRLTWDGYIHIIPANSTADIQTYLVDKYLREMTDKILRERQDKAVAEENARRKSRGEKEMDKFQGGDQPIVEGKFAIEHGMGSPQARQKIYQELYLGLVKEYGVERVEREKTKAIPTTHEQLMDNLLGSKRVVDDTAPPILSEVEESETKSKKDKKQTLIEQISQK